MSVNKLTFNVGNINKSFNLNIDGDWEYSNLSDAYEKFERDSVKDVINIPFDYEVERFSNEEYDFFGFPKTELNYSFNFFNDNTSLFSNSYLSEFTANEIYYGANSFKNSFFKLDFYDTVITPKQKIYLTLIIPTYQGSTEIFISPNSTQLAVKKPLFKLDFIGDKEGFFIYWLKKRDIINIDTFFVSAKFFNGKTGGYTRFTNDIISTQPFNMEDYFYYKVKLNYDTKSYVITTTSSNIRVGDENNQIKWFEYNG